MSKNIYLILGIILLTGCVHRQILFEEKTVSVLLDERYHLKTRSGKIIAADTIRNLIHYKIIFDEVRGGDNKLFGKITINEGHGYKTKRLEVYNKRNELVTGLSINEITNSLQNFGSINLEQFISKVQ